MRSKVQKWGNSLAIRIPRSIAVDTSMDEGCSVDLSVRKGKLVVTVEKEAEYSLDELLKGVTPENRHGEADWGKVVGREVW